MAKRGQALDYVCATCRLQNSTLVGKRSRRSIHISATPSSSQPQQQQPGNLPATDDTSTSTPDARFEVLGAPFSLLSASLAASQHLYTRKGTLIGYQGVAENATSHLSLLSPFRRALLGIPFLYQRVTSTTPYTALIAPKSSLTSLVVVHLDGRLDWMVAQRKALLAWTGHTLSLSPTINRKMSLSHWGNTTITGRGLLALSGKGLIHQVSLKAHETYIVNPSHILAYTLTPTSLPQPYRFKANAFRLQIPNPINWLPETKFWNTMRETTVWRFVRDAAFVVRTWGRRVVWGDRLFLQFSGPAQILIQSRGSALSDVLTSRDVNEIADAPAGVTSKAITMASSASSAEGGSKSVAGSNGQMLQKAGPTKMSFATVGKGGAVTFAAQEQQQQQ